MNLELSTRSHKIYRGEKPFECSYEKVFNSKSDLVGHQHTYTEEKPYGYKESEKTFNSLILHQKTHIGEKLYEHSE